MLFWCLVFLLYHNNKEKVLVNVTHMYKRGWKMVLHSSKSLMRQSNGSRKIREDYTTCIYSYVIFSCHNDSFCTVALFVALHHKTSAHSN